MEFLFKFSPGAARRRQAAFVLLAVFAGAALLRYGDLTPQVESDFFFSTDDRQIQADREIRRMFPSRPQLILSAQSPDIRSLEYGTRIHTLSLRLLQIEGVLDVRGIRHGPKDLEDLFDSPLWSRLLVSEDESSTYLILTLETDETHESAIPLIERLVDEYQSSDFRLAISGVPFVVHEIRRQLLQDLKVFSVAAILTFSLLILTIYRSGWILLGGMIACLLASILTLLVLPLLGTEAGILSPNVGTIVFVLTLSHIVFLTANWRNAARSQETLNREQLMMRAVSWTGPASLWSMVTTLIGFLSLIWVEAKPLQEFGFSCAVGSLTAILSAYLIYPAFLASARAPDGRGNDRQQGAGHFFHSRHPGLVILLLVAFGLSLPGLGQLQTDPPLPSFFKEGSELRNGIERIDRSGGSTPLEIVVQDNSDELLNENEVFERMWQLQLELEQDPSVGSAISLPVLMAEADRAFLSFLFSWESVLKKMEGPEHNAIARSFVTPDRTSGRFLLRMKELDRNQPRRAVVERLHAAVRKNGFEPVLTGGFYWLQGELAELMTLSMLSGMGALAVVFSVIAFLISRSPALAAAMIASFCLIPAFFLGVLGQFRIPLDIISAPGVTIAMALGIDNLIHLVFHARRQERPSLYDWKAWVQARADLWPAILGSSLIIAVGFSLFLLSNFPPTQRLGLSVVAGTVWSTLVVLLLFPIMAAYLGRSKQLYPTSPS